MNYQIMKKDLKKVLRKNNYFLDIRFEGCETKTKLMEMIGRIKRDGYQVTELDKEKFYFAKINNDGVFYFLGDSLIFPEDCSGLFKNTKIGTLDFSNLDSSNIVDMSEMFQHAKIKKLDLSSFNTSNLREVRGMFGFAEIENLDLSNFDSSNIVDMSEMFALAKIKKLDLSNFNTSNLRVAFHMFCGAEIENLDVSNLNLTKLRDMNGMFSGYQGKKLDLSGFDFSNVCCAARAFEGISFSSETDELIVNETFIKRGLIDDLPKKIKVKVM